MRNVQRGVVKEIEMNVVTMKGMKHFWKDTNLFVQNEREADWKEGVAEGIEKDIYSKTVETAKDCLILKMLVETVSVITGLKPEGIAKS